MKRNLSLAQLRELVLNRRTKGDAFRLDNLDYVKTREQVSRELERMSKEQIMSQWPELTYDVK